MAKIIGIMGGMGPQATVTLFNKIVNLTDASSDQEHIQILIDNNTLIPDRTAYILGGGESPLEQLIISAKRLETMGADFLIMPCNTAHFFIEEIKREISIPFINMIEETLEFVMTNYRCSDKVGLLATDGTIYSKVYDFYFNRFGIEVLKLSRQNQNNIMKIIYDIKKGLNNNPLNDIEKASEEFINLGSSLVILGCTELSVINEKYHLNGNYIDPVNILAESSIKFAGKKIHPSIQYILEK